MSSDITRLSQEPDGESMNSSASQCVVSCNTIICYFGNGNNKENNEEIASAMRDKKQTGFLLKFLKPLSPHNIECKPTWLAITCNKQIYDHQIQYINETLQDTIKDSPEYKPLTKVTIMLQVKTLFFFFFVYCLLSNMIICWLVVFIFILWGR